jgi:hypothetical protein
VRRQEFRGLLDFGINHRERVLIAAYRAEVSPS